MLGNIFIFHTGKKFFPIIIILFPVLVFAVAAFLFLELATYKLKLILAESLIFALLIFLAIRMLPLKRGMKNLFLLGYIVVAFKIFFQTSYYYLYGDLITPSTIYILLETNLSESFEYLQLNFSFFNVALILILLIPLLFFRFIARDSFYNQMSFLKNISLYGGAFILLFLFYQIKDLHRVNLFATGLTSYKAYQLQTALYNELGLNSSLGNFKNVTSPVSLNDKLYVVIIGESTTNHKMGLYGYPRQTNPRLSGIKKELKVFEDVISPHTHTIESLTRILTLPHNEKQNILKGSLVQLMNAAGFKTYWLSNQKPVGWNENLVTKISRATHESIFINHRDGYLKTPLDEDLIPKLEDILANSDGNAFIVIHLMGTHMNYVNRYPASFDHFKGVPPVTPYNDSYSYKIINQYDNAVLYNDYVIHQVIEMVRKKNKSSYVLYISDHGEDVYEVNNSASHTISNGTEPMFDIPFVLWTSQDFENENNFKYHLQRKYILDDFIYSVADLSGVFFDGFEPVRSIFSESFEEKPRLIQQGVDYDLKFKK